MLEHAAHLAAAFATRCRDSKEQNLFDVGQSAEQFHDNEIVKYVKQSKESKDGRAKEMTWRSD